jgi:flagellar basal-body rod protein FlgC
MSLFSAVAVGASGMAAQRARAEVLVENLANAETTRTPEGGPYRRKDVVFGRTSFSRPVPWWKSFPRYLQTSSAPAE